MINAELEEQPGQVELATEQVPKSTTPNAKEVLGSLESAISFLEGIPKSERLRASRDLVSEFTASSQSEVEEMSKAQEDLYVDLIQKGVDGYLNLRKQILENGQLLEGEKKEKLRSLENSYRRAQQLRRMVRSQAISELLVSLSNPYSWAPKASTSEFVFSLDFETATSFNEEKNRYESFWDPKAHFIRSLAKFFSEKDVEDIRKFIGRFFDQHHKVNSLKNQVQEELGRKIDASGYDRQAAKLILKKIGKWPNGDRVLGDYTKIVIGMSSITICLSYYDYQWLRNDEMAFSSGGCSFPGTVLNLSTNNYETENIIDHENEHTLFDMLGNIHETDKREEFRILAAQLNVKKEYSEQELEIILEKMVKDVIEIRLGRDFFMTRFADELLAYKLGDKQCSSKEILENLNHLELYRYLNVNDKNILGLVKKVVTDLSFLKDYHLNKFLRSHFFSEEMVAKIKKKLNKDLIYKIRENAAYQVDRLIKTGIRPEKIRALLTPNNILDWEGIVNDFLSNRDILSHDKASIRNLITGVAEKRVGHARKVVANTTDIGGEDFTEIPEEEKVNFQSLLETIEHLKTCGFSVVKDGFFIESVSGIVYKTYRCSLRKIVGDKSQVVYLDKSSSDEENYGFIKVHIGSSHGIFEKTLNIRDSSSLIVEDIDEAVVELEEKLSNK